jgi:plastocyanin
MSNTFLQSAALFATLFLNWSRCCSAEQEWGTLKGQVVFAGETPKATPLVRGGVVVANDVADESFLVDGKSKGIANVVIYLTMRPPLVHPDLEKREKESGPEVNEDDSKTPEVKIKIKDYRFVSHVTIVRAGAKIRLINQDPVAHPIHWWSTRNVDQIVIVDPKKPEGNSLNPFKASEKIPVKVTDHIYPWMYAYWVVLDHPYVAVTDKDGQFEIPNLPFGDHSFKVWQESHGYLDRNYTVKIANAMNEQKPLVIEPR